MLKEVKEFVSSKIKKFKKNSYETREYERKMVLDLALLYKANIEKLII